MVTGDNAITARSIADKAGMLDRGSSYDRQNQPERISEYTCMEGAAFRAAVGGLKLINGEEVIGDMHKFREIKRYLRVLARCTP
jgi:magnesium-transporting ATPase (P-type)